jgi:hypothetical protein
MDIKSTCLGKKETEIIVFLAENMRHALRRGNVHVVKTILRSCDAFVLFREFKKRFCEPIVLNTIDLWCDGSNDVSPESMESILGELVNAGADMNEVHTCGLINPIIKAITERNLTLCKILLRLGAEPAHTPDTQLNYASPLSEAVWEGPEYVALLLQYTQKLTARDEFRGMCSALVRTVANTNFETLNLFMNWYENSEQEFPWVEAFDWCISCCKSSMAIGILQRPGVTLTDNHNRESLDTAASRGSSDVMLVLIEHQPEVLQSEWLVNNNIPCGLRSRMHQDFVAWLRDVRSQPLSLQLICRLNILRQLRSRTKHYIEELPLPKLLKEYLKEAEVFATFSSQQ